MGIIFEFIYGGRPAGILGLLGSTGQEEWQQCATDSFGRLLFKMARLSLLRYWILIGGGPVYVEGFVAIETHGPWSQWRYVTKSDAASFKTLNSLDFAELEKVPSDTLFSS